MATQQDGTDLRILVMFRCHNPLCVAFETPLEQPITRTALREMCQPDSTDRFMCPKCGEMFLLTNLEKANSMVMLDEEAATQA
jgi:hypothetical protein